MNADRRDLLLRALPAVLLVSAASMAVAVAALLDAPSAADWVTALVEAGEPRDRLLFTLAQALASTALGLALGLVASWFLARPGMPLAGLLTYALLVPVAVPGVAFALGLRELTGDAVDAVPLLVWAHAAFTFGVTVWVVTPSWGGADRRLVEQSVLLGAPRWRAAVANGYRAVGRQVILAGALGFTNASAAVGTVMVLGDADTWTVEATLFREATAGDAGLASTLAGMQLVLGLAAYLGAWRWTERTARARRVITAAMIAGLFVVVALGAAVLAPVVALVAGAFRVPAGESHAFADFLDAELAGEGVTSLLAWSLVYAFTAGIVATALAWLAAPYVAAPRRSWWREGLRGLPIGLLLLVLLVSPVVAALGTREVAEGLGVDLQGTWAVMAGVYALVAFPVALRVLTSVRRPDSARRLTEASVLLGETPRSAQWRWQRRLTLRAVLGCLLIVGAVLLGEAGAAALLAPDAALPSTVGLLAAAPVGEEVPAVAYALGSVLSALGVVAFALGEWLRRHATLAARVTGPVEGR